MASGGNREEVKPTSASLGVWYRSHDPRTVEDEDAPAGLDVLAVDHRADTTALVASTEEAADLVADLDAGPADEVVVADARVDPETVARVTDDDSRLTVPTTESGDDALETWWAYGRADATVNWVDERDGEDAFAAVRAGDERGVELQPLGFGPNVDRSSLAVNVTDRAPDRPDLDVTVLGSPDLGALRGLYDDDESFERTWVETVDRYRERLRRHDGPPPETGPTMVEVPDSSAGQEPLRAVGSRWTGGRGARCLSILRPGDVLVDGLPPLLSDVEETGWSDDRVGLLRSGSTGLQHRQVGPEAAALPPTLLDPDEVAEKNWYPSAAHPGDRYGSADDREPAELARIPVDERAEVAFRTWATRDDDGPESLRGRLADRLGGRSSGHDLEWFARVRLVGADWTPGVATDDAGRDASATAEDRGVGGR